MTTIVYFLLAIGILVFVHEMGHYLAARHCGVQVLRFSFGFGKELVKRTARKTGTEWVVAAIPLGGYVKMNDASFESKGLAARAWIVFAGPLANLIFAVLAYSVLFSTEREEPVAVIAQPAQDTPASKAGLRSGDRIVAVDGHVATSFTDVRWRMAQRVVGDGARETRLQIDRQGQQLDLSMNTTVAPSEEAADPARVIAAMGLAPFSESVKVVRVQDDSPAAAAGMRAGDRIMKVNGEATTAPI
ncbi:MAG: RIP metalloprotease RseP, partial [Burkholderiaceae bacterium]